MHLLQLLHLCSNFHLMRLLHLFHRSCQFTFLQLQHILACLFQLRQLLTGGKR